MEVIGLCGRAQAGKSTVGRHLQEKYGYFRFGIADSLKALLWLEDPIIEPDNTTLNEIAIRREELLAKPIPEVMEELKHNLEVRRLLQNLGTGARQVLGENIWIDKAISVIMEHNRAGVDKFVITDVRFPNEATIIRERLGGRIWKVIRMKGGWEYKIPFLSEHESEMLVDQVEADETIIASTVEELLQRVDVLMKKGVVNG